MPVVEEFKYVSSTIQGNRGCDTVVEQGTDWIESLEKKTRMPCDRREPIKFMSMLLGTVAMPAMVCGLEAEWVARKR